MSQFAKLFEAVKAEPKKNNGKKKTAKNTDKSASKKNAAAKEPIKPEESFAAETAAAAMKFTDAAEENPKSSDSPVKVQKPIGKSRDADYTQVLAYIRKDTHREIKKVLIDDANKRNLSDLVEELLGGWLNEKLK